MRTIREGNLFSLVEEDFFLHAVGKENLNVAVGVLDLPLTIRKSEARDEEGHEQANKTRSPDTVKRSIQLSFSQKKKKKNARETKPHSSRTTASLSRLFPPCFFLSF